MINKLECDIEKLQEEMVEVRGLIDILLNKNEDANGKSLEMTNQDEIKNEMNSIKEQLSKIGDEINQKKRIN